MFIQKLTDQKTADGLTPEYFTCGSIVYVRMSNPENGNLT